MSTRSKWVTRRFIAKPRRIYRGIGRSRAISGARSGPSSSAGSSTRSTSTSSPFILIDIQQSFTVDRALAGALGTVTLMMRLVGGTIAGTAADKWGRKLPLMLSVLWFSIFAFLSGFSTSYAMLFALRALFGIGMGGEWAAGMPLVLEHWPTKHARPRLGPAARRLVLGLPVRRVAFQFIYPLFSGTPDLAWRVMFWVAIVPGALHAVDPLARHGESGLARRSACKRRARSRRRAEDFARAHLPARSASARRSRPPLVIGSFMCIYYSVNYWYPTFLREAGAPTLPYLAAFNVGAIAGTATWGRLSETRLGRRGAATITMVLGHRVAAALSARHDPLTLGLGALMMGFFGMGVWGMAPAYSNERFPTEVRGVGPGFCYHAGAAIGALMPFVLGALQDRGFALVNAMSAAMVLSGLAAMVIWLGPETRGRVLRHRLKGSDD